MGACGKCKVYTVNRCAAMLESASDMNIEHAISNYLFKMHFCVYTSYSYRYTHNFSKAIFILVSFIDYLILRFNMPYYTIFIDRLFLGVIISSPTS